MDIFTLSDREREVFHFIGLGKSAKSIASILSVSTKTVACHRENIKAKLKLDTSCDLCSVAKTRVLWGSVGASYQV